MKQSYLNKINLYINYKFMLYHLASTVKNLAYNKVSLVISILNNDERMYQRTKPKNTDNHIFI